MTTHELARLLLTMKDVPAKIYIEHEQETGYGTWENVDSAEYFDGIIELRSDTMGRV